MSDVVRLEPLPHIHQWVPVGMITMLRVSPVAIQGPQGLGQTATPIHLVVRACSCGDWRWQEISGIGEDPTREWKLLT